MGIYLEDYEPFLQYFLKFSAYKNETSRTFTNENFLIYPILIHLYKLFPNFPIYEVFRTGLNIIGFSFIHFFIIKGHKLSLQLVASFTTTLFFLDNIVLTNNVRTAGIFTIAAILIVHVYPKFQKRHSVLFGFLILLSVISRFEIPLILLVFYALAIWIKSRKVHKSILVAISIVFIINVLNIANGILNLDNQGDFNKYEHSIFDMGNTTLSFENFGIEEYDRVNISLLAKANFINDEKLDDISFDQIIRHANIFDYVFQNEDFISHNIETLKVLYQSIQFYIPFTVLLIAFFSLYILFKKTISFYQLLLISLLFSAVIIVINIYTETSIRFTSIFFLLLFSIGFVEALKTKPPILFFSIVLLIGIYQIPYFASTSLKELQQIENINQSILQKHQKYSDSGKELYLGSLYSNYAFPNRIFSNMNFYWKNIDYATMNSVPVFQKDIQEEFGISSNRMDKKFEKLIQENNLIVLTDFNLFMYSQFLKIVYKSSISFQEIEKIPDSDLAIYKPYFK